MQMQIEGQEITYKDLPDLREKLTGLLAQIAEERAAHDTESARLARQEKKLRKFLGDDAAPGPERADAVGKGAGHE